MGGCAPAQSEARRTGGREKGSRGSWRGGIALTLALLAAGCRSEPEPAPAAEVPAEAPAPAARDTPTISDAAILNVAITAHAIEARFGELALTLSEDAETARFAEVMVVDHRALGEEFRTLASRLNVMPSEHELSRRLEEAASTSRPTMDTLSTPAFDRAYFRREVEFHQGLLQSWDRVLIPSARDAQLKTLLENARPTIEGHLLRARQIRAARGG